MDIVLNSGSIVNMVCNAYSLLFPII